MSLPEFIKTPARCRGFFYDRASPPESPSPNRRGELEEQVIHWMEEMPIFEK